MSTLGPGIVQSVAGLSQAQRVVAQDKATADAAKPSDRRVRADRPDEVVVGLETAEAVRSLKDNTHEETREDHAQHSGQGQPGPQGQQSGAKHFVPGTPPGSVVDDASPASPAREPQERPPHIDVEA